MTNEKTVGPMIEGVADGEEKELTADDILAIDDEAVLKIRVPEWVGVVRFKSMTGNDAIGMQRKLKDPAQKDNAIIQMFVMTAIDRAGNPLFDEDAVRLLKKKRFSVFLKLQHELLKFNGYTKEAEETVKND